jgi:hypothetical protein
MQENESSAASVAASGKPLPNRRCGATTSTADPRPMEKALHRVETVQASGVYSASGIKSTGAEVNTASGIKSEARKTRRKKSDIAGIKKALFAILEADHPQTIRQVYYQMVGR